MTVEEKIRAKDDFLEHFRAAPERPSAACAEVGISLGTYRRWRREDCEFDRDCEMVDALGCEAVMESLRESAEGGNVPAARLYFERKDKEAAGLRALVEGDGAVERMREEVDAKAAEVEGMLRDAGKWAPERGMQVRTLAMAFLRLEKAYALTAMPGYMPVRTETTKDGRVIQTVNPVELVIQRYGVEVQSQLKALGMNMDSRERDEGGDVPPALAELMMRVEGGGDD